MFCLKEKVVYPGQGVAQVKNIINKKIADEEATFYELAFLSREITVLVPVKGADDVGLRALSTHECVKDIMTILTKPAEPLHELDNSTHTWNKRNKEYLEKLKNGNLQELSEMYRDLHYIAAQKELSFGERGLLNQIENLLVEEIATVEETGRERMLEQVRMLCINQAQKAMVQKVI